MAKGGSFENKIAKLLSVWWTDGERDDVFGRSDSSGARFTARRKKGKDTANMAGDLTFTDVIGAPLIEHWCVECKTGYSGKNKVKDSDGDVVKIPVYAKRKKGESKNAERKIIKWKDKVSLAPWDVLDFIDSRQKRTTLEEMWNQCDRDAELSGKTPILIFRRNRREPCICMTRNYYLKLGGYYGKRRSVKEDRWIPTIYLGDTLVLMPLDAFFEWTISFPECLKSIV